MHKPAESYRETLFQWIWGNLEFNCTTLATTTGEKLEIVTPGVQNHGAGPDFLQAQIRIDGIDWFGSVEIHKNESEWNDHGHDHDSCYNTVILHVVYQAESQSPVRRNDGTVPPVLELKPFLGKPLSALLSRQHQSGLPCANSVTFINQRAFEEQVAAAHKEYFIYNVDQILNGYNPNLSISQAWYRAVLVRMYDILGIPANRMEMRQLVQNLYDNGSLHSCRTLQSFVALVQKVAFSGRGDLRYGWRYSGMRPASRPETRVKQAAALHYIYLDTPFSVFLDEGASSWDSLIHQIPVLLRPGASRLDLIKNLVFLPALYLLGDLLYSQELKYQSYTLWREGAQKVPGEMKRPFREAGFRMSDDVNKLGLAHQFKRYCRKGGCQSCEVFKYAIRS